MRKSYWNDTRLESVISEVLSYGAMQHGAKLYEGNLLGIDLYEANLEKVNLCGATVIA